MKKNLLQMTFGLWMICSGPMIAQNAIELEFYNCSNSPTSLCVTSPGVRLPDNNQFNLGQSDPNSSSCSVHFSHEVELRSACSSIFQYMIEVSYYDTSAYEEILSWTAAFADNQDEATLTFDTEQSTNDVVSANGLPYTSGCFRYHRIRWTVMDLCGNTATCEKRFELYDCHAPIPISNQGPNILAFHSSWVLAANMDDIAGEYLDDCGSTSQFLFSTTNTEHKNDTLFQICDVPAFGVLVIIPLWVADQGRDLNCNGSISWDERTKYQVSAPVIFTSDGVQDCDTIDIFLIGNVRTSSGHGIAKTYVTVTDTEQAHPPLVTDNNGHFEFPSIYSYPITITAARNHDFKNGVSTLDLVKIQKHLLGIEPFTSAELLIAADVNSSSSLSAIDLVVLRKLILGLVDTLPGGKSWKFFAEDSLPKFSASITIANQNNNHVNFLGIKVGDVNNTADPQFTSIKPRSNPPALTWITEERAFNTDDIVEIPIKCIADDILTGFQFTLSDPNLEFIGIKEGTIDIMSDDYALMDDQLTMSWFSISPVDMNPGDILFTVKARAKAKGSLQNSLSINSSVTNAEVYDENEKIFTPKLEFSTPVFDHLILYPNVPNPWKEETTFTFYLAEASNINLNVYSTTGQIQYHLERNFEAGQHEIVLNKKEFTQRGLMVYTIQSNTDVKSGKMIISE